MVCEEKDPLRTYTEDFDPVYRDSAMEAFFQFIPEQEVYLNFEVNANGALLAAYGPSRVYRSYFFQRGHGNVPVPDRNRGRPVDCFYPHSPLRTGAHLRGTFIQSRRYHLLQLLQNFRDKRRGTLCSVCTDSFFHSVFPSAGIFCFCNIGIICIRRIYFYENLQNKKLRRNEP